MFIPNKKTTIRRILTLAAIISIIFLSIAAKAQSNIIQSGEELLYEVSFMGIKLGSIRVLTLEDEECYGQKTYRSKSFMDSYSGLPFVNIHAVYNSWMSRSVSYSYKFSGSTQHGNDTWGFQNIYFDYEKGVITNKKWENKELIFNSQIETNKKYNDGLSLYFLARQYANLKRSIRVPSFIDKDTTWTHIFFKGIKDEVEIEAVDYPIKTIYFNGKADWTGIYGITGNFEGWFSDDEARVPIFAKMKVYIGSVDIELKEWKRIGWKPPKAK